LRKAFDDLKYQAEDQIKTINIKENHIDFLNKDILAWKELAQRLSDENTDHKQTVEELEDKNRKMGEVMNTHLYNRAA
jgi:hypothetical protein